MAGSPPSGGGAASSFAPDSPVGFLCRSVPAWVSRPPIEAVVFAWGASEDHQLGLDTEADISSPKVVEALLGIKFMGRSFGRCPLVGGSRNTLAIDADGGLWSWGWNDRGTLGHGHRALQRKPAPVEGLAGVEIVQAAIGGWHCLALDAQGQAYCWGGNEYQQCGLVAPEPLQPPALAQGQGQDQQDGPVGLVAAAAAAFAAQQGAKSDGGTGGASAACAGVLPAVRDILVPRLCMPGLRVRQVACGGMNSVVLTESGEVWTWGEPWGEFALELQRAPRKVPGAEHIAAIACGSFHNLALVDDGRVLTWGTNDYGQLGNGSTIYSTTPGEVVDLEGVAIADIAAGGWHSMALSADGQIYVWGRGEYGRLGIGDRTGSSKLRPHKVRGLEDHVVVQVAAGGTHSLAVTAAGRLFIWGRASYGRLGLGRAARDAYAPVEVALPGGHERWRVAAATAGGRHTMCLAVPVRETGLRAGSVSGNSRGPSRAASVVGEPSMQSAGSGTSNSLAGLGGGGSANGLAAAGSSTRSGAGGGQDQQQQQQSRSVGFGDPFASQQQQIQQLPRSSSGGSALLRAALDGSQAARAGSLPGGAAAAAGASPASRGLGVPDGGPFPPGLAQQGSLQSMYSFANSPGSSILGSPGPAAASSAATAGAGAAAPGEGPAGAAASSPAAQPLLLGVGAGAASSPRPHYASSSQRASETRRAPSPGPPALAAAASAAGAGPHLLPVGVEAIHVATAAAAQQLAGIRIGSHSPPALQLGGGGSGGSGRGLSAGQQSGRSPRGIPPPMSPSQRAVGWDPGSSLQDFPDDDDDASTRDDSITWQHEEVRRQVEEEQREAAEAAALEDADEQDAQALAQGHGHGQQHARRRLHMQEQPAAAMAAAPPPAPVPRPSAAGSGAASSSSGRPGSSSGRLGHGGGSGVPAGTGMRPSRSSGALAAWASAAAASPRGEELLQHSSPHAGGSSACVPAAPQLASSTRSLQAAVAGSYSRVDAARASSACSLPSLSAGMGMHRLHSGGLSAPGVSRVDSDILSQEGLPGDEAVEGGSRGGSGGGSPTAGRVLGGSVGGASPASSVGLAGEPGSPAAGSRYDVGHTYAGSSVERRSLHHTSHLS